MKEIVAAELLAAVKLLGLGVTKGRNVSQASMIHLRKDRLLSFNDEVFVWVPCEVGVEGAVAADLFAAAIGRFRASETVGIEQGKEGAEVVFVGEHRRIGLRLSDSYVPDDAETAIMEIKLKAIPDGLLEALKTAAECGAASTSMPEFSCVHLVGGGDEGSYVEATDAYQAIRVPIELKERLDVVLSLSVGKVAATIEAERWGVGDAWAVFDDGEGRLVAVRRYEGKYPTKVGDVLRSEGGTKLPVEGWLKDAAKRAAALIGVAASSESIHAIQVEVAEYLTLRASGVDGWYEEQSKVDYIGEPLKFRMAPGLLARAAEADEWVRGGNVLRAKFGDAVWVGAAAEAD